MTKRKANIEPSSGPSKKLARATDRAENITDHAVNDNGSMQSSSREMLRFYSQDCISLARSLLGKVLVRVLDGERLAGRIVETEAYLGIQDSACHSYKGHKSARNKAMWMDPGTVYIYLIYGMYHCMNISSQGDGCAVLLRALEPIEGEAVMQKLRSRPKKPLKSKALCSGPGKLTEAMDITKFLFDKENLVTNVSMWLEDGLSIPEKDIIACPRIGVNYATPEWRDKPIRFYVRGSEFISKRDKTSE